ncbi:DUF1194 domain-containing protein [Rhodovulum sulfidophilum]|uniref:DUF1194 domain-containing protein n=1 Tax=Rhodovulum sulfidophilum TaxID=35806 RepID=UPI001F38A0E6|nr:DUF1194 domain-containing protein [Rhodovulum sulfidophilum]MCE8457128.1 DUF1194 domain-containing protein [Rhodovulum sulfidophilum]
MERHARPETDPFLGGDQIARRHWPERPTGCPGPVRIRRRGAPPSVRGERLLAEGGAFRQATLDLNADGTSNDGPQPREGVAREVTVNALAIGIGAQVQVDHAETDLEGR